MGKGDYFLNREVLKMIGAGAYADFQHVYECIVGVYETEIQRFCGLQQNTSSFYNRIPEVPTQAKNVCSRLLDCYTFLFTDESSYQLYIPSDYSLLQIDQSSITDKIEYVSFEEFLFNVEKIAIEAIYRRQSRQDPSISKGFVHHRVNLHVEFTARRYRAGEFSPINTPQIRSTFSDSKIKTLPVKSDSMVSGQQSSSVSKLAQSTPYTHAQKTSISRLLSQNTRKTSLSKISRLEQRKRLFFTNFAVSQCLSCAGNTSRVENFVAISDRECITFTGKYCSNCNAFYTTLDIEYVDDLQTLCKSDFMEFHTEYLQPEYISRRNLSRSLHSSVALFVIKKNGANDTEFVTVVSSKGDQDISHNIIHYTSLLARKLLLALSKQRTTFSYYDKFYTVLYKEPITRSAGFSLDYINPNQIVLRKGGGLLNGIKQIGTELVDILLYSPFTDCFEVAHVTYDLINCIFYMDAKVFRRFLHRYGNPGIILAAQPKSKSSKQFYTMQEESVLHAYGYNVGISSDLTEFERQEILGEVLDLELMTARSIINLLDHNINMHPGEQYIVACSDWEADKEFVFEYKINPSRFFIAK